MAEKNKKEKVFTSGMFFNRNPKAPAYILGNISIKVPEFVIFLEQNQSNAGYVNIDVKQSVGGKIYCELSSWKPKYESNAEQEVLSQEKLNNEIVVDENVSDEYPDEQIDVRDIPF